MRLSRYINVTCKNRFNSGIEWLGIALKLDWCSFEDKATSLPVDSIGVALGENAQSSLNSPSRRDFTDRATQATPPTPNEAIDTDSEKFKATPDESNPTPEESGEHPKLGKIDRDTPETYRTVLILQDVPLFVGVDGRNYLLHRQDVASIPAIHAKNLIKSGHAQEIHVGPHPRWSRGGSLKWLA